MHATVSLEELCQRRVSRKTSAAVHERAIDTFPGLAPGPFDDLDVALGITSVRLVVPVRPFQYLFHGQVEKVGLWRNSAVLYEELEDRRSGTEATVAHDERRLDAAPALSRLTVHRARLALGP